MIFRGLLVALSGFAFIFAPGVPMGLLYQRYRTAQRSLLVWGIGAWLLAQLVAGFAKSMISPLIRGGFDALDPTDPSSYIFAFLGSLITAFFLSLGLYLLLRREQRGKTPEIFYGLTIGFGAGVVAQVFNGLNLVGSGFRLVFGDTSNATQIGFAETPILELIVGLLSLILFRIALLMITSLMGVLIAYAITGVKRNFWLAILLGASFEAVVIVIALLRLGDTQFTAGGVDLVTSLIAITYYVFTFSLGYLWLTKWLAPSEASSKDLGMPS